MNLYGVYYQEEKNLYEIVLIGDFLCFENSSDFTCYEAFAMDKKTLDYNRSSFIVEVKQSCELIFTKNIMEEKNFLYTKLLKINKNIKINVNKNVIKVKIK